MALTPPRFATGDDLQFSSPVLLFGCAPDPHPGAAASRDVRAAARRRTLSGDAAPTHSGDEASGLAKVRELEECVCVCVGSTRVCALSWDGVFWREEVFHSIGH